MKIFGILRTFFNMEAVNYYRTASPLRKLGEQSDEVQVVFIDKFMARRNLRGEKVGPTAEGHDIYTTCRMYNDTGNEDFLEEVHKDGGLFVFDSDDDLTETYRLVSGRADDFNVL